jgi:TRAP-type C4-dicarboxylate transport system permease small subunit
MRKKRIIAFAVGILVIIIVIVMLYAQTIPATPESSIPEELPTEEIPSDLLVIPEVPLGTLGVMLAFFFALVISQVKHKVKLP